MKNNNLKFILTAISFLLLLGTIDFMVGKVGDLMIKSMSNHASGDLAKDNYRLNRLEADIVLVGSSRATTHYISNQLKDSICRLKDKEYTIYNAGLKGRFVNNNSCAVESILERYNPKLLIFEVNAGELCMDNTDGLAFSSIHYKSNKIVKKYLDGLGLKETIKYTSALYRFNQKLPLLLAAQNGYDVDELNGYDPLYGINRLDERDCNEEYDAIINQYSLLNFTTVLKTAKSKNIPIVVTTSPEYKPVRSNEIVADICSLYDVPYIDMCNHDLFNSHPEYFYDVVHLNHDGAQVYTALFFENLKPYIEQMD